jgi:hypothetical protein
MDGRMKAVMPGKIDESGIIGDTTAGITAVWISLGTPPTAAIRPEGLPSGPQEQSYSWASRGLS